MEDNKFDKILDKLGTSYWNCFIFAMSAWVSGTLPANFVGSQFTNPEPRFYCEDHNTTERFMNNSCSSRQSINGVSVQVPCTTWVYDRSIFQSTIAMEWDLVCDRKYLRPIFQTTYTIGCLFGSLLGGIVAERYGRKCAVKIGSIMTATSSIILGLSPNLLAVFLSRFMLGVFNTVMVYPAYTFAMEVSPPKLRSLVGVMLAIPYALMMIILAVLAYFIRNWRTLQLFCSIPAIILVPLTFMVEESPRWLLSKGKLEETTAILKKAASQRPKRSAEVTAILNDMLPKLSKDLMAESCQREGFLMSIFHPLKELVIGPIKKITIFLTIVWFCQAVVYLGIPLSSNYFSSPYMYMIVIGLVELPAYTVTAPITHTYGRKKVIVGSLMICGICIFLAVITQVAFKSENCLFVLFACAYLMICTSYQVNFIYAQEILPTPLRPFGVSLLALTAYIGFSVPPFLIDILGNVVSWAPHVTFSACAFIAGSSIMYLPETNHICMSDTIADTQKLLHNHADTAIIKKGKKTTV